MVAKGTEGQIEGRWLVVRNMPRYEKASAHPDLIRLDNVVVIAKRRRVTIPYPLQLGSAPAVIAAVAICVVFGSVSLLVPPFIDWDSASGFLAWRGSLLGAVNSVISPDRADITRDTAGFLTVWSPGQYLIPGAISWLGIPLGIAMTLTVALALFSSLIGWAKIVRIFSARTSLALLTVLLIGSFHYSTHAFSTYHGGEILLQAATPWLILAGYRIPKIEMVPAALLAVGTVFGAFLAKLTGLIVVAAALIGGSMVALAVSRRITRGMIGGAVGALSAIAILYVSFFSRGPTAVSATSLSLPLSHIAFALLVPWVAGFSWSEPVGLIFFPQRDAFSLPSGYLVSLAPLVILVAGLVLSWQPQTTDEKKCKLFSLWLYGIIASIFAFTFIHGGGISLEERHFRSAGTFLFLAALMSAYAGATPRWAKGLFLAICTLMAFYGIASFADHEFATAKGPFLDRTSWTNQRIFDADAVEFARSIFADDGRKALFVVPSPELGVIFPVKARVMIVDLNFEGDRAKLAEGYSGRVPGHLVVLLPNNLSGTSEGRAVLSAFKDYAPAAWKKISFREISVYLQ